VSRRSIIRRRGTGVLNLTDVPRPAEEFGPREFSLDIPVAAALLVVVSLCFAFYTISKYGGRAATGAHPASSSTSPTGPSAEALVNLSLDLYRHSQLTEAIAVADRAIALRPDLAEAWNNKSAALSGLGRWDEAITAAEMAIQLKPDFALARNNLAWAVQQKTRSQAK
jgi:tetratricopeptide (TPR) repeat protein